MEISAVAAMSTSKVIEEARAELRAAIIQIIPSDCQTIANRVRRAEALLSLIDTREVVR